ncbi:hypothetical protein [Devosia sp.]|uniref:hypothetical protein n=1 Tax=Devosia sp. TaxID=1871048 RepID=UPI002F14BA1C
MLRRDIAGEIVGSCVAHLFSLLGSNGKFTYAHRQFAPEEAREGYNLLRHCGTVWFMCKAIRSLAIELTPQQRQSLAAALGYIRSKTKEPPWAAGLLPTLCMTSKDVVKLGGVGLAALMIRESAALGQIDEASLAALYPEGPELHCIRLENYIVAQLNGHDFFHKRVFTTGEILPFESDYYTGEALFALMRSPRRVPRVRTVMEQLLDRGYGLPQQSHWMAYAACAALRADYCDAATVLTYIERLIDRIISDPSYRQRQESTPIACRTEALVEILQAHRQVAWLGRHLAPTLVDAARATVVENLTLQLRYYGEGQFKKGRDSDKVQIDYIQHNGAAFLGWSALADQ